MDSSRKKIRREICEYYRKNKRDLPWRRTKNPYRIVLSEIMLQQTQVERVKGKYSEFLAIFPTLESLAKAPLSKVLNAWQGLGYNRRAVNLHKMAKIIIASHKGKFPQEYSELIALPGIGQSTAGALLNFCWNIPQPFIETNIRSVYLHHFFKNKSNVTDKEILEMVEMTIDEKNPREWFYALYDYGTMLKKKIGNQNQRSAHYKKQSAFKGSNRELRSRILQTVLKNKRMTEDEIIKITKIRKENVKEILRQYTKENVLEKKRSVYEIVS